MRNRGQHRVRSDGGLAPPACDRQGHGKDFARERGDSSPMSFAPENLHHQHAALRVLRDAEQAACLPSTRMETCTETSRDPGTVLSVARVEAVTSTVPGARQVPVHEPRVSDSWERPWREIDRRSHCRTTRRRSGRTPQPADSLSVLRWGAPRSPGAPAATGGRGIKSSKQFASNRSLVTRAYPQNSRFFLSRRGEGGT